MEWISINCICHLRSGFDLLQRDSRWDVDQPDATVTVKTSLTLSRASVEVSPIPRSGSLIWAERRPALMSFRSASISCPMSMNSSHQKLLKPDVSVATRYLLPGNIIPGFLLLLHDKNFYLICMRASILFFFLVEVKLLLVKQIVMVFVFSI